MDARAEAEIASVDVDSRLEGRRTRERARCDDVGEMDGGAARGVGKQHDDAEHGNPRESVVGRSHHNVHRTPDVIATIAPFGSIATFQHRRPWYGSSVSVPLIR